MNYIVVVVVIIIMMIIIIIIKTDVIVVFLVMTPCCLVGSYQHLEPAASIFKVGNYNLNLHYR
jgi:hypothetical protein